MQRAALQPEPTSSGERAARPRPCHLRRALEGILCGCAMWLAWGCRDLSSDQGYCNACQTDAGSVTTSSSHTGTDAESVATPPTANASSVTDATVPDSGAPPATMQGAAGLAGNSARAGAGAGPASAGRQTTPRAGGAGSSGRSVAGTNTATAGARAADGGRDAGPEAGSSGGLAPTLPCAVHCSGDTPVCDPESLLCVRCTPLQAEACPNDRPACDAHTCVECTESDPRACQGESAKPVCHPTDHRCVECISSLPSSCTDPRPRCDDAQQQCVECLEPSDCAKPERSRCDAQQCKGCEADADCARLPGLPACERGSQTCVACTVEGEATQCPASQRCDSRSHKCVPRGNPRAWCEPCETDAMCAADARCANVLGIAATRVCLPLAQPGALCSVAPYLSPVPVDANASDYVCAPDQTCQTVLAALGNNGSAACTITNASVCGAGVCVSERCRYPCLTSSVCPQPLQCDASKNACTGGYVAPAEQ